MGTLDWVRGREESLRADIGQCAGRPWERRGWVVHEAKWVFSVVMSMSVKMQEGGF